MLSLTVTPGTQIATSTTLDPSVLNLLGKPTVTASGTISASEIVDATITEGKLDDSCLYFHVATDSSTVADTFKITATLPLADGYTDGMRVHFKAAYTNTGASTLEIDNGSGAWGLTNYKLVKYSYHTGTAFAVVDLAAGDIRKGQMCDVVYHSNLDGANPAFVLLNPLGQPPVALATCGGSTSAITLTTAPPAIALTHLSNRLIFFKSTVSSTTPTTINIDGLSPAGLPLKVGGIAVPAGVLRTGGWYVVSYDSAGSSVELLNSTPRYESTYSTAVSLTANTATTFTHGLGATPRHVRCVLVCGTGGDSTTGHSEGDEVEHTAWMDLWNYPAAYQLYSQAFHIVTNATSIIVAQYINNGATGWGIHVVKKDGSAIAAPTADKWKLKVYAEL